MLKKLSLYGFILFGCCALLFSFNSCKNKKAKAPKPVAVKPAMLKSTPVVDTIKTEIKEKYATEPDYLNDKVNPKLKLTYRVLLEKIFHGIQKDKKGNVMALSTIPIRNALNSSSKLEYMDTLEIPIPIPIMIKSAGKSLLLLECEIIKYDKESPNFFYKAIVLGLFNPHSGKLLDRATVEIGPVDETYIDDIQALSLQQDAIVIYNFHHNSSQGYNHYSFISVVNNRLKKVFDFLILNDRRECQEIKFDPPKYIFSKNSIKQFGDVWITLTETKIKNPDDYNCEGKKRTSVKKYKAHLIWDNRKKTYINQFKDFARLYKQNQANF